MPRDINNTFFGAEKTTQVQIYQILRYTLKLFVKPKIWKKDEVMQHAEVNKTVNLQDQKL